MERLSASVRTRTLAGLILAATCGCVTTTPSTVEQGGGPNKPQATATAAAPSPSFFGNDKPQGGVCQVATTWQNQVMFTPDPTHGGEQTPGLAGRLYLFDQNLGASVETAGSLVVDLMVPLPEQPGQWAHLEQWQIDRATLKRLEQKDAIGIGYTLFLPWATYRPGVRQVQLRVKYEPTAGGAPIYGEPSPLTLNGVEATPVLRTRMDAGPPKGLPQGMRQ